MRSARPMRSNRAPGAPIRHAADMLITAGMHHDGQGYNLLLQAMPLDGKLVPRVYRVVEGPRHQLDRRVRTHRPMRSSSARAKLDSASASSFSLPRCCRPNAPSSRHRARAAPLLRQLVPKGPKGRFCCKSPGGGSGASALRLRLKYHSAKRCWRECGSSNSADRNQDSIR